MTTQLRKLDRWPKKRRNDNSVAKEICDLDLLFDIFCYNNAQRHSLKKQHDLSMTEKDDEYCNEQKYLDEVEPVQSTDITFQKR